MQRLRLCLFASGFVFLAPSFGAEVEDAALLQLDGARHRQWPDTTCLTARWPRPDGAEGPRMPSGRTTIPVARLGDLRQMFKGFVTNPGLLNPEGPRPKKECAREVPKILHFIWVGSPLRTVHSARILQFAEKNPLWKVFLWVDQNITKQEEDILQLASFRPAGAVEVKWLPGEAHRFRNWDLVERDNSHAGKADYIRLEVVYLYGGIYTDIDSVAVHGFDEYGTLFRWPFVTVDPYQYRNLCNCLFSAEPRSAFLDFALDATRENCLKFGLCQIIVAAGPHFFTAAYLRYNSPDILLLNTNHLLHPKPRGRNTDPGGPMAKIENVMFQTFEHSW